MGTQTVKITYQTPGMVGVTKTLTKLMTFLERNNFKQTSSSFPDGTITFLNPLGSEKSIACYGVPLKDSPFPDNRHETKSELQRWKTDSIKRMHLEPTIRNAAISAGASGDDIDLICFDEVIKKFDVISHPSLSDVNENFIMLVAKELRLSVDS